MQERKEGGRMSGWKRSEGKEANDIGRERIKKGIMKANDKDNKGRARKRRRMEINKGSKNNSEE